MSLRLRTVAAPTVQLAMRQAPGGIPGGGSDAPALPGVPSGFTRLWVQDFDTVSTLGAGAGTFGATYGTSGTESNKLGLTYDGNASTNGTTMYSSAKCCTTHDGSLFVDCHSEGSTTYAAAPYPWISGARGDFLYGQWGGCVRLSSFTDVGYKIAFLLWPFTGQWTNEIDFPETDPDTRNAIKAVSLSDPDQRSGAHGFSGNNNTGIVITDGLYHSYLLDWPAPKSVSISASTNRLDFGGTPHNRVVGDRIEFGCTHDVTFTANDDTVTFPFPHKLIANATIAFRWLSNTGAGLSQTTSYYVKTVISPTTITLALTSGGALINLTADFIGQSKPITTSIVGAAPLITDTTYYVNSVISSTALTISLTSGGATLDITTDGSALVISPMTAYLDGVQVYQWTREVSIPTQKMYAVLQCEGWITAAEGGVPPPLSAEAVFEIPWAYINAPSVSGGGTVTVTPQGDGTVVVSGATVTSQGDGTEVITGATVTSQGDGTALVH